MPKQVKKCKPGFQACGGRCIPEEQNCKALGEGQDKNPINRLGKAISGKEKWEKGQKEALDAAAKYGKSKGGNPINKLGQLIQGKDKWDKSQKEAVNAAKEHGGETNTKKALIAGGALLAGAAVVMAVKTGAVKMPDGKEVSAWGSGVKDTAFKAAADGKVNLDKVGGRLSGLVNDQIKPEAQKALDGVSKGLSGIQNAVSTATTGGKFNLEMSQQKVGDIAKGIAEGSQSAVAAIKNTGDTMGTIMMATLNEKLTSVPDFNGQEMFNKMKSGVEGVPDRVKGIFETADGAIPTDLPKKFQDGFDALTSTGMKAGDAAAQMASDTKAYFGAKMGNIMDQAVAAGGDWKETAQGAIGAFMAPFTKKEDGLDVATNTPADTTNKSETPKSL